VKSIVFKTGKGQAGAALAFAVFSLSLLAACSQGRIIKVTPEAEAVAFEGDRGAAWISADSLWDQRRDTRKAWASLVAYRAAAAAQPRVPQLWTQYAHACYFLATYTEQNQEWSNPERAKGLYLEGTRAAEAALRLNAAYRDKLAQDGDENEALRVLTGPWHEPAFWLAANRGRWALGEGRRTRMDGRDRFEALVRGIAERSAGTYHGGPDRFLGVMYAVASTPQLDLARSHFDRALATQPLFFANLTLRAEYLAVAQKDSAAFRSLLESVLRMPADTLPEAAVENEYEQARATNLLSRQAEFFP
jgi:hypothetical protein